jgi:Family of unknown function (DUF5994)
MQSTDPRQTTASPALPAKARLLMQQDRTGRGLLDGGWWPRTNDPAAELPGLIPELDERHGRITRIMLGIADWDGARPRLLSFPGPRGRRVVKLGWFDSMPAGLLTAISASGERTDLVTIPPQTSEEAASAAMRQAVNAGNHEHSPAILDAITMPAADSEHSS